MSQIHPDRTRSAEVAALLGKPQRVVRSSTGGTVWQYSYMTYMIPNSYTATEAEIVFDKTGVVRECRIGEHSQ